MYDTGIPIQNQRCVPAFPGVNITIDSSGALIPMPGMSLPKNWSPEEWELNTMLAGGHRNNATQATVDDLGLYTIRTWNTSMALAGVSIFIWHTSYQIIVGIIYIMHHVSEVIGAFS